MSSSVTLFSSGKISHNHARNHVAKMRQETSRFPCFFVFDIDGTLIENGLEVGVKKEKTVDAYCAQFSMYFSEFQSHIQALRSRNIQIVICTGRGRLFSEMIARIIFWGNVDVIICEGGCMLVRDGRASIFPVIQQGFEELHRQKKSLVEYVSWKLGWSFEEGKEICLSFNPSIDMTVEELREEIQNFLVERGANMRHIYVTNSNSAVDINPQGIDKLSALRDVVASGMVVYFGDAHNDLMVMMHGAHIIVAPANASQDIKECIEKSEDRTLGILAEEDEIIGVNAALWELLKLF